MFPTLWMSVLWASETTPPPPPAAEFPSHRGRVGQVSPAGAPARRPDPRTAAPACRGPRRKAAQAPRLPRGPAGGHLDPMQPERRPLSGPAVGGRMPDEKEAGKWGRRRHGGGSGARDPDNNKDWTPLCCLRLCCWVRWGEWAHGCAERPEGKSLSPERNGFGSA